MEWLEKTYKNGRDPVGSNVILAGNNAVATDAIGTMVMGFNPLAEFPERPVLFDINHLRLASSMGLGPIDPSEIKIRGEKVEAVKTQFNIRYLDDLPPDFHLFARKELAEEVKNYRRNLPEILSMYNGKIIGIEGGKISWSTDAMEEVETKFRPRQLTIKYRAHLNPCIRCPSSKKWFQKPKTQRSTTHTLRCAFLKKVL